MDLAQVVEMDTLRMGAETEQVQLMAPALFQLSCAGLTAVLPVHVKLLSTAVLGHMCRPISQTSASAQLLAQQQQAT